MDGFQKALGKSGLNSSDRGERAGLPDKEDPEFGGSLTLTSSGSVYMSLFQILGCTIPR